MTFSIVAFDPATRSWGVAVASKCLAVGYAVPWGGAEVGAIATQALANLSYGPDGLELLRSGLDAGETVARLVADDPLADQRQLAVVDAAGRTANHTGPRCIDWKGHRPGENFTVQGNLLDGPQVVDAMAAAYDPSEAARRAAPAAVPAGGRGRRRRPPRPRVGGDVDLAGRRRLRRRAGHRHRPARRRPRGADHRARPAPRPPLPVLRAPRSRRRCCPSRAPWPARSPTPSSPSATRRATTSSLDAAFARWSGVNNYEERTQPGQLDPIVWAILQEQASAAAGGRRDVLDRRLRRRHDAVGRRRRIQGDVRRSPRAVGRRRRRRRRDPGVPRPALRLRGAAGAARPGAAPTESWRRSPPTTPRASTASSVSSTPTDAPPTFTGERLHDVGRWAGRRLVGRAGQHPRRAARRRGDGRRLCRRRRTVRRAAADDVARRRRVPAATVAGVSRRPSRSGAARRGRR